MERIKVSMLVYNNFRNDARVRREAVTLAQHGYDISVIAVQDDTAAVYEERDGIRIFRTPQGSLYPRALRLITGNRKVAATAEPSPMYSSQRVRRAAVFRFRWKQVLVGVHRLLSLIEYYYRCTRIAHRDPADIYHAHDLNTLLAAYWIAKKQKSKLIYDSHELYVERNRRIPAMRIGKFLLRKMEHYLIRRSDAVITVNDSIANLLADWYRIVKPHVIMNTPSRSSGNMIPPERSLRELLNVRRDHRILLYIGGITFNRGLEHLIDSMSYLPDCHLVFMGYGANDYKQTLQRRAVTAGVAPRFSFYGPVPPDEVTSYAAGADVGVAPIENACLSYYYCSPNKIFECLQAGLPVIASDFPEMKRVIEQHDIGCTFDPSDPEDIASAAKYILDHPEVWERMKQNTNQASKCYNWENEAKKLVSLYGSL